MKVKVHMYSGSGEIRTQNFNKVFDVYMKNGKPGIDWNVNRLPYSNHGDIFTPLDNFASSVIFEDVENGKAYHWSNIKNYIEETVLLNDMCYGCKELNCGCAGTTEKVWTSCIYKR